MNIEQAVTSLIKQELDARESFWNKRFETLMRVGYELGGEKNFTCKKNKTNEENFIHSISYCICLSR